ncbi:MAG: hypothetical protein A2Z50_07295 [Nitrospirae bacterium RBG_19FT_COMBO_42_15]|nr:MAG: hypothetical protein A2Z50_07295 [Nitrospirae bacterium RBG_19FT_COMBO_42_15]
MFARFKFLIFLLVISITVSCSKSDEAILIRAAEQGDGGKVIYYLKKGAPIDAKDGLGYTALMKAASNGQDDIVNLLLERKANVNAITVFGTTALMQAAWKGHIKIVKLLLENNADIHMQGAGGWNVLFFAVSSPQSNSEIVRFLLEKGLNPNMKDYISWTPIMWTGGNLEIVKILRQNGAQ